MENGKYAQRKIRTPADTAAYFGTAKLYCLGMLGRSVRLLYVEESSAFLASENAGWNLLLGAFFNTCCGRSRIL